MQVSECMHQGVTTAQINDSLRRVATIMKKKDIGAVPIYKNERPVGFVTDRDIVLAAVASGHSPDEPVSLAMKRDIIYVYQDQDITEAKRLMASNQISRLLVVDRGDRPVGMLTLKDISNRLSDKNLKADVLEEIKQ